MSDGSSQCVYITILSLLFILVTDAVQFWKQVMVLNHWYLWDWVSDHLHLFHVRAGLHSTVVVVWVTTTRRTVKVVPTDTIVSLNLMCVCPCIVAYA